MRDAKLPYRTWNIGVESTPAWIHVTEFSSKLNRLHAFFRELSQLSQRLEQTVDELVYSFSLGERKMLFQPLRDESIDGIPFWLKRWRWEIQKRLRARSFPPNSTIPGSPQQHEIRRAMGRVARSDKDGVLDELQDSWE